jgi:hypothetical protein
MTGSWPKEEIDHKNCIYGDDRWTNLREASPSQNKANRRLLATNTSGYKGVSWLKRERKWHACLCKDGKICYRGYFDDPREAFEALKLAAEDAYQGYWRAA